MSAPLLKLSGFCRVTGNKESKVLRWLDRGTGNIEASRYDTPTSGHGDHRRFARPSINKAGIAAKLIHLGINPGQALTSAAQFTDFGDSKRAANEIHEFGRTILIHTATGTTITNLHPDSSLGDALGRPMLPAIVLDIGPVILEIDEKLSKELKRK
jgi:hypothetical protein